MAIDVSVDCIELTHIRTRRRGRMAEIVRYVEPGISKITQALCMSRVSRILGVLNKTFGCAFGVVVSLIVSTCLSADELSFQSTHISPGLNEVDYRDGRLTLSASNTTLVELMLLIGARADFDVVIYGDITRQTETWSFFDMPLAEAIEELLGEYSAMVSYRQGKEDNNAPRISRVYLLGTESDGEDLIHINRVEPTLDNRLLMAQAQGGSLRDRLTGIDRLQGLTDEFTVKNLAFSLKHDPDPEVRSRAATALGEIGGVFAASALEAGLGDEHASVRIDVVQALAGLDDERISLWLGQIIMGDSSTAVRLEALRTMALYDTKLNRIFLQAATADKSQSVRDVAVKLLGLYELD